MSQLKYEVYWSRWDGAQHEEQVVAAFLERRDAEVWAELRTGQLAHTYFVRETFVSWLSRAMVAFAALVEVFNVLAHRNRTRPRRKK